MSYLLNIYRSTRDRFYKNKRATYFEELKQYFDGTTSIIASNCFAGTIYQDLNLKYSSPTLGLYFMFSDYIDFLENLEKNLKADLVFVSESKYPLGNERMKNWKHEYPVALLDGKIEIHFLHYLSNEEANEKWKRRCERINMKNLVIIASEQNLVKEEDIIRFDKLPFKRKVFLTSKDYGIKSAMQIKAFEKNHEVGDPVKQGNLYYEALLEYIKISKWKNV